MTKLSAMDPHVGIFMIPHYLSRLPGDNGAKSPLGRYTQYAGPGGKG